jgi:PKHD-type hydroxylase
MNSAFIHASDILTPDFFTDIEKIVEALEYEDGQTLKSKQEGAPDPLRKSHVKWIKPVDECSQRLLYHVNNIFLDMNDAHFGFDIFPNRVYGLQYTEYRGNEQGHYGTHIDSWLVGPLFKDRKLSMTIQLSDSHEYTGGDFEIDTFTDFKDLNVDKEELRKKGTVFVFPSFLGHRVTPVTSGLRKSLVAWIEGPKFR